MMLAHINLNAGFNGFRSIIIAYERKILIKMHPYKILKASDHQKAVLLRNYQ